MSFIDVASSNHWPRCTGSTANRILRQPRNPDAKKIRLVRGIGVVLLVVAIIYLGIKLAAA
jgi:hypothetical protein